LKRTVITTSDGSTSIHLPEWNEQYHSKHGAVQEARHVFIQHGLNLFTDRPIALLEMGFGTGLNAFITLLEANKRNLSVAYTGVEAYPVDLEELRALNFVSVLQAEKYAAHFEHMHRCDWESFVDISSYFTLRKQQQFFQKFSAVDEFDLIYFDAFGARVQPDLWEEAIFQKMFQALKDGGVLVTYSAKGSVRRALQAVGLEVERLPGPPGKREMLRATKPIKLTG